jgi:DNA-binding CsgD family transcriptional regulator
MQTFILQLRTRGISAILVHHSGKSGDQRGTSHREDVLDTVINLRRPGNYRAGDGARFEIIFEKARNLHGEQIPEIEATLREGQHGGTVWAWERLEDSQLRQIIEIKRGTDLSQAQIAQELKVSQSTVSRKIRWAKENGLL